MPDKNGILTDEKLLRAADKGFQEYQRKYADGVRFKKESELIFKLRSVAQATFAHLGKVTDEELIDELSKLERPGCRGCKVAAPWAMACGYEHRGEFMCKALAQTIIAKVTPILSARFEKEKQEAEEQARIEERKAIGEFLNKLGRRVYLMAEAGFWTNMVSKLKRGESLRSGEPKE